MSESGAGAFKKKQLRKPPKERNERLKKVMREDVVALVKIHSEIEEPMLAAIWIYQDSRDVWLVELLPDMLDSDDVEVPISYSPGPSFRYPLKLIIANQSSLWKAIHRDQEFALAVFEGEILYEVEDNGKLLQKIAANALKETPDGHA